MKTTQSLVRCLFAVSALLLPIAAHADKFSGTATFTDTSSINNNDYYFTGSFASPSFTFTGNQGTIYTDTLTLYTNDYDWFSGNAGSDQLKVTVNFTAPSSNDGIITGTGTLTGWFDTQNDIDWANGGKTNVTFSDGSVVQIYLPDFDYSTYWCGSYGQEDMTMTVMKDPVTPEPSSLVLLGTALMALAGLLYRRNRHSHTPPVLGMPA